MACGYTSCTVRRCQQRQPLAEHNLLPRHASITDDTSLLVLRSTPTFQHESSQIGGSSAGGNLAAAVTLRCRDEGGPRLRFQLLEVPALDLTRETARATLASGVLPDVPQPTMDDATSSYLEDPAQARDPLASPLLAEDLSALPPAHVMTAEYDVLRTEGERYAERLVAAGVPATHRRYPGALHGTAMLTRTWDQSRQWQRDAAQALRRAHWATAEPDAPGLVSSA
ncbi:MAG TPA: alpha/beta hydrolase fold domain-containing protein [Actinomycetes bacterium]